MRTVRKHAAPLSLTGLVLVAQLAIGGWLWPPARTASDTAPVAEGPSSSAARPTFADAFPVAEAQFAARRPKRAPA